MSEERIFGLQSYAIRDVLSVADAAGTAAIIAETAAMGYRSMELRPEDFTPAPAEMKAILADHGMTVCAMHAEMTALDDDYDEVIRRFRTMGCSQVVIPSRPRRETDIPRFIDKVAYYARRVQAEGLHLQYHNHVAEFARLDDGTTMMARLLDLADGGLFS
ncbi:MAG: TIM barrel protein, partial [Clostridia bacterium]|nr:TIM barrel protein [Clostridia bacterium]